MKTPREFAEKNLDPEERMKFIAWERSRNEPCNRPNAFFSKFETD